MTLFHHGPEQAPQALDHALFQFEALSRIVIDLSVRESEGVDGVDRVD